MSEEEKKSDVIVHGGGQSAVLFYVPSLLEVVRSNKNWEHVYTNVDAGSEGQELMKDHALSHFHSVAAETVGRLEITGMTLEEIAEDTGLSQSYVNSTLNAMFETKRENKIEY